MGMRKQEVQVETSTGVSAPSPALPSFSQEPKSAVTGLNPATTGTPRAALSKEVGMMRGGVAHDAATITAAMSAMKTDDEVKVLFTSLYRHILSLVSE